MSRASVVQLALPGDDVATQALVRALAQEVARGRTLRRGGRGHWTQWEEDHPTEAVVLPFTYHQSFCRVQAANHYIHAQPCHPHCDEQAALLDAAAVYLGVPVATLYPSPKPKRRKEVPHGPAPDDPALADPGRDLGGARAPGPH